MARQRAAAAWRPRRWPAVLKARLTSAVGGPSRRRAILLLAAVLALDSADQGALGAVGGELRPALGIDNAQLGLLAAVVAGVSAAATIPMGVLVDRVRRVDLLAASIVLWGCAMLWGALAGSYEMLLISRLALGAVMATAVPAIASLTGDLFPPAERARVYGYILAGELVGSGIGLLVGGTVAGLLSWRWAFGVLGVPAFALAWALRRRLREPRRGGADRMAPARGSTAADEASSEDVGRRLVQERGIEPDPARVLREDPARMPLRRAAVYVLRIRTNVLVIVSSSIGYLFFSGLRTFGVSFARGHFSLSQALASILFTAAGAGALVGVVAGGRLSDRMLGRGRLEARILVAVLGYVAAGVVLVPSLLVTSLAIAFPLYLLGAAAFSAPNPALDAARLDVVPGALWGRAEGVRTTVRTLAQAAGPLVFGLIADALGGSHAAGTRDAFLIMLVPLALNGALLVPALRSYPRDMAGAMASEAALRRPPARP